MNNESVFRAQGRSYGLRNASQPLPVEGGSRHEQSLFGAVSATSGEGRREWASFLRPALPHGGELVLILDASASMDIWRRTLSEFRERLRAQGMFRSVWTWRLRTDVGDGELRLEAGLDEEDSALLASSSHGLCLPEAQRLILVVSDCVSRAWHSGAVARHLASWGRSAPVALVQVLPEALWSRTALRNGSVVTLRAPHRCAPNAELEVIRPSRRARRESTQAPVVPVLPLNNVAALGRWAQLVAGDGVTLPGFELHPARKRLPEVAGAAARATDASTCVQYFLATASTQAWKLATFLSAAPVSLPVMRLIQEQLLPESNPGHLAEVFLGGLIRETPGQEVSLDPDAKRYDFRPGVRELLQESLPTGCARKVLLLVSGFLESQSEQTRDFPTLLIDPKKDPTGFVKRHRDFTRVAVSMLQRMGGEYARLARRLAAADRVHVELHFHAAYRGLEANVLDNKGQVVTSCVVKDESPWLMELPGGSYVLALPDVGVRQPLEVQSSPVSLSIEWAPSGRSVLVIGSGTYGLTRTERWVAEAVGDLLARAGHTVLTGGWPGVDHMVEQAYTERLRAAGLADPGSLFQVLPEGKEPYYKSGQVISVPAGIPAYHELVRRAEVVVLIGGTEGSFTVYKHAQESKRPLVPIASTGGAAWLAFQQLWADSEEKARERLDVLRKPVRSQEDARALASRAVGYLHSLLFSVVPVPPTREPTSWASVVGTDGAEQALRDRAEEYEELRERQHPEHEMNALVERVADEFSSTSGVRLEALPQAFTLAGLGGRVVLLGLLLARKAPYCFDLVRDVLTNSLSPFEQYTALRVADRMVELLGRAQRGTLLWGLVMLRGTNKLRLRSDPNRENLVKRLISRLEKPEKRSPEVSSVPASQEELFRAVYERLEDVKWGVFNALPEFLTGLEVSHPGLPSDNGEAIVRGHEGACCFLVDDASLRRVGARAVTLDASFFVCGASLELRVWAHDKSLDEEEGVEFQVPEQDWRRMRVRVKRLLELAVQVRVELKPPGNDPVVSIQEVAALEVVDRGTQLHPGRPIRRGRPQTRQWSRTGGTAPAPP